VIEKKGLPIGNNRGATQCWTREGNKGESVIDLTLANIPITKCSIQANNQVTECDHMVREWDVEVDRQEEAIHDRVVGWN
jgi:hypothetical protein